MAKTTYKGLLQATIEAAEASKVPIRTVEYDPKDKKLRVEFFGPTTAASAAPAAVDVAPAVAAAMAAQRAGGGETRFIPGTTIPDDGSPVDALEIAASRPRYNLDPESRGHDPSNGVA